MASVLEKQTAQAPMQMMTFEQFLAVVDEDDYAEWVDSAVILKGTESAAHQDLLGFSMCLLKQYAEDSDTGKVLCSPFLMKLPQSARAPDLLFIAQASLTRLKEYYLNGPADLAIEIVSPESVLRDRSAKYAEYEAGGVREYWIIDADAKRADFFVLDGEGRYQRATPDDGGRYESAILPGFWVNVGWLWQTPLPSVRSVLKEWNDAAE